MPPALPSREAWQRVSGVQSAATCGSLSAADWLRAAQTASQTAAAGAAAPAAATVRKGSAEGKAAAPASWRLGACSATNVEAHDAPHGGVVELWACGDCVAGAAVVVASTRLGAEALAMGVATALGTPAAEALAAARSRPDVAQLRMKRAHA